MISPYIKFDSVEVCYCNNKNNRKPIKHTFGHVPFKLFIADLFGLTICSSSMVRVSNVPVYHTRNGLVNKNLVNLGTSYLSRVHAADRESL